VSGGVPTRRPWRTAAVGAVSVLLAAGGCALIVGTPVGEMSTDAGRTPAPDGGDRREAGRDARADSPRVDGAIRDAGPARDSRSGADADAAAPRDAGEGGATTDATDGAGGFCARYVPPPDAILVVCDDFDENPDATALGTIGGKPGGSFTVQEAVYKSPPRSLLVTDSPPDAQTSSIDFTRTLEAGTTFTVASDTLIGSLGPSQSFNHLMSLTFEKGNQSSSITVFLNVGADGGVSGWGVIEQDPVDGGYEYLSHTPKFINTTGWLHVVLSITQVSGHYTDTLVVNGTTVEQDYGLQAAFFETEPAGQVGITYAKTSGLRQVYFDNVVFTVQ